MGRYAGNFEWLIFGPALLLVSLGLITLLSINPDFFYQQLLFSVVGLGLFWIFARIDFELYHYLDKFIYGGCVLFLLMTYLGPSVRGSTRWIEINFLRIQPSELVKPFLILAFSSFLIRYPPTKLRNVLYHLGFFLVPFILVFIQPDLGNALVYLSFWFTLMLLSGIEMVYIAGGAFLAMVVVPLGYQMLRDYQKLRLATFLNPFLDPRGAGYNAVQSMIAVGSGMLWGRGFGRGTQSLLKFLPEHHTDFIFAALVEIFGFAGGIVVLAIFLLLFWRLLKLAREHQLDSLIFLYIVGLFTQLFTQVVINIGMNLGIVPITGITLPFISYGGSSLLTTWIALGILVSALKKQTITPDY